MTGEIDKAAIGAICEVIDEATALLADHVEGQKHLPDELIERLWRLLHEQQLIQAMYDVGHFPRNTPPTRTGSR